MNASFQCLHKPADFTKQSLNDSLGIGQIKKMKSMIITEDFTNFIEKEFMKESDSHLKAMNILKAEMN
jgi:hypothetical protein